MEGKNIAKKNIILSVKENDRTPAFEPGKIQQQ